MASLYTQTPEFFNDLCDVIRLFLPEKHITQVEPYEMPTPGLVIRHFFSVTESGWRSSIELYENGELQRRDEGTVAQEEAAEKKNRMIAEKRLKKHAVKRQLYRVLAYYYQKQPPWGALTGIRPTKLLRELADTRGMGAAMRIFADEYFVKPQKIALAEQIVQVQRPWIQGVDERDVDLYIGIPFCVSRCKYCSFISRDITHAEQLKAAYLPQLRNELYGMRSVLERYRPRALYIGGGTPTALSAEELKSVLFAARELFPSALEFTVEAGRPDTVDEQKLLVIRESGAQRISVNAQTTKDETLARVGRKHNAEDFFRAFELARAIGFHSINTDLILGLPGEDEADVARSLRDVLRLLPENITVHTLAIKNSSEFALERQWELPDAETMERMVEAAQEMLLANGYLPYYLYRQKYMSGNLENVGFAKPGYEGIYNIDIMEETVSNMAFGAGGISKRLFPKENRIERAANVKDVAHYVERTEEMVQRKKALFEQP